MRFVKVEIAEPIFVTGARPGGDESATAQVFPMLLSDGSSEVRKHFVVCAYFPPLNQAQRESIASQLRLRGVGVAFDFIIHNAEGDATVVSGIDNDKAWAFDAAAAAAVMKAKCGWDESNPIIVRVNNIDVLVVEQFNGSEWIASVPNAG